MAIQPEMTSFLLFFRDDAFLIHGPGVVRWVLKGNLYNFFSQIILYIMVQCHSVLTFRFLKSHDTLIFWRPGEEYISLLVGDYPKKRHPNHRAIKVTNTSFQRGLCSLFFSDTTKLGILTP